MVYSHNMEQGSFADAGTKWKVQHYVVIGLFSYFEFKTRLIRLDLSL